MKTGGLNTGDVVEVDIRGCRFPALLKARLAASLFEIEPLVLNLGYYRARSRQIRRRLPREDFDVRVLTGSPDAEGGQHDPPPGPAEGSPPASPPPAGQLFDPQAGGR